MTQYSVSGHKRFSNDSMFHSYKLWSTLYLHKWHYVIKLNIDVIKLNI